MTDIEFAKLVRTYRALQNLRLVDLATKVDLSLPTLVKIEKTGNCLLRTKILIAKALKFNSKDFEKLVD